MNSRIGFIFCGLCLAAATGCDDNSSNSQGESASGTAEKALADVVSLNNTIRDSFAGDDVDAAHDPLHQIGAKLEELSSAAAKTFSGDDAKSAEDCVNKLFAAYGEIDKTFHGEEGANYEDEAKTIDEAIEKLNELINGQE